MSSGGGTIGVSAAAGEMETLFVEVFDPNSGPLTGMVYAIDFGDVDRFDQANVAGTANNSAATATDLGRVVDQTIPGLTLLPLDEDWFRATMRAVDGTLDVLVNAQFDPVLAKVWKDSDNDGVPDTVVATANGNKIKLEDIPAAQDQVFWVQLTLVNPANLGAPGSVVQ